jgi:hypothetical protein
MGDEGGQWTMAKAVDGVELGGGQWQPPIDGCWWELNFMVVGDI